VAAAGAGGDHEVTSCSVPVAGWSRCGKRLFMSDDDLTPEQIAAITSGFLQAS
jgi:hypothetical protein